MRSRFGGWVWEVLVRTAANHRAGLGVLGILAVTLELCTGTAVADGKFYPPAAFPAQVSIPDQRALIWFSNGVERLVIETRFASAATNLAWVVPLPAQPTKIEAATPGLFPTLQFLCRPEIVSRPPRAYWLPMFLGGLGFLILTVKKTGRLLMGDVLACLLTATACGAAFGTPIGGMILFTPFFAWAVHSVRVGKPYLVFVCLVCMVPVVGMFLPASTKAKAGGTAAEPGVEILGRQLVGAFDTTTLTARDPGALHSWLTTHGFAAPTNTFPVIEDYVRHGWVFVAAKIHNPESAGTNAVHPLAFTFPTERAVYPMRLTGVGLEQLGVELYVFGANRAAAPSFRVEHCSAVDYPHAGQTGRLPEGTVSAAHPALRRLVDGAPALTKLTAILRGRALQEEVWLDWVPFAEHRDVLYSKDVVLDVGFGRGAWAACAIALAAAMGQRWRTGGSRRRIVQAWIAAPAVAAAVVVHAWVSLPRTQVRLVRNPGVSAKATALELEMVLADLEPGETNRLEAARQAIRAYIGAPVTPAGIRSARQNPYLGGPVREEDSPGNYQLREGPGGVELYWYDGNGAETQVPR